MILVTLSKADIDTIITLITDPDKPVRDYKIEVMEIGSVWMTIYYKDGAHMEFRLDG